MQNSLAKSLEIILSAIALNAYRILVDFPQFNFLLCLSISLRELWKTNICQSLCGGIKFILDVGSVVKISLADICAIKKNKLNRKKIGVVRIKERE